MDKIKVSKTMSYILRHHPEEFNLKINPDGSIAFDRFIAKLKEKFNSINEEDIVKIVRNDPKGRFSISDNKRYIRANYGHSIEDVYPEYEKVTPPKFLYHGTARRNINSIKNDGLLPGNRNFVHLSETKKEAFDVGRRHDAYPVVLIVEAKKINLDSNSSIDFYKAGGVYLCKKIPSRFIIFSNKIHKGKEM
ncbi:MAG: RNA 2'-phosphotransferase [Candidatus Mcinerneyibacterium aminivorans]|jgi:putative RNA 2'-phosphotransferase|uniref:Probable RNA 2'-phosphotransferase n=1 Tax=Candidatus Mcinerneyibacterium aminivorans TaxID=2703815 RepID=A0A5D0MAH1_9BACT|nr:MAG: RNA 2'-phosphotransferase [Candidatus Mcinerneyibacterium aminivorans]